MKIVFNRVTAKIVTSCVILFTAAFADSDTRVSVMVFNYRKRKGISTCK